MLFKPVIPQRKFLDLINNISNDNGLAPGWQKAIYDIRNSIYNGELDQQEIELVLSVFDSHFSSAKHSEAMVSGVNEESAHLFGYFLQCFISIVAPGHGTVSQGLAGSLAERTPRIVLWFKLMTFDFIIQGGSKRCSSLQVRLALKQSILLYIRSCLSDTTPSSLVQSFVPSPTVITILLYLMKHELDDEEFYNTQPTCITWDVYFIHQVHREDALELEYDLDPHLAYSRVLFPTDLDFEQMALTWIGHLRKSTSSLGLVSRRLLTTIHMFTILLSEPLVSAALVKKNSMSEIIKVMNWLADSEPFRSSTPHQKKLIANALSYCCFHIKGTLGFTRSLRPIIQFLEAGGIQCLLNCDRWMPFVTEPDDRKMTSDIIRQFITQSTLYRSTFEAAKQHLPSVGRKKLTLSEEMQSALVGYLDALCTRYNRQYSTKESSVLVKAYVSCEWQKLPEISLDAGAPKHLSKDSRRAFSKPWDRANQEEHSILAETSYGRHTGYFIKTIRKFKY
ncbi:hypothetical protein C8Q75DRAFT_803931 [Abortiporus biennis]|nr:hypothetical protein C8Q75DRAFT_803931 [Abortiporus biennis]